LFVIHPDPGEGRLRPWSRFPLVSEVGFRYSLFDEGEGVIKLIQEDGRSIVRTKGSHRQFKHKSKSGLVTIAGKPSDELAPGTLNSVLRQAGLK